MQRARFHRLGVDHGRSVDGGGCASRMSGLQLPRATAEISGLDASICVLLDCMHAYDAWHDWNCAQLARVIALLRLRSVHRSEV